MHKNLTKQRRINRSRRKIIQMGTVYLSVHRTPRHIYAQVFSEWGHKVIAAASSIDSELKDMAKDLGKGKQKMAEAVGKLLAKRAKSKGISKVAFDRSGYKYHGRIKALAEGARANGLEF
jgi:large subunit ribosomal protein L18